MGVGSLGSCVWCLRSRVICCKVLYVRSEELQIFHSRVCWGAKVLLNKYLFSSKGIFPAKVYWSLPPPHLWRWIIKWKKGGKFYSFSNPSDTLVIIHTQFISSTASLKLWFILWDSILKLLCPLLCFKDAGSGQSGWQTLCLGFRNWGSS